MVVGVDGLLKSVHPCEGVGGVSGRGLSSLYLFKHEGCSGF